MQKPFVCLLFVQCFVHCADDIDPKKLLNHMSLDQRIGQLFMVPAIMDVAQNHDFIARSPYKKMAPREVEKLITDYHVGGVIFLGTGTKLQLQTLAQQYQSLSKTIPLLIGLDAEWGLSMRLTDGNRYPRNMTLGAIEHNQLIKQLGKRIGQECAELGVHINFAPVLDINTNPNNPVIHMRSFGKNKDEVMQKALSFMRGLHEGGVLSCAKHFPGHGDTDVDSHLGLPVVEQDADRLSNVELWPYKKLRAKMPALMTGHLSVPALDESKEPATLSQKIITEVLRKQLQFEGLIITDGLGMKAVLDHNKPGELELKALLAGNDILLCPVDVPEAVALIKQAIKEQKLTEQELNAHVERILFAKARVKKARSPQAEVSHDMSPDALNRKLYEAAVTLVDDEDRFKPLTNQSVCLMQIGNDDAFAKKLPNNITYTQYYFNNVDRELLKAAMQQADITVCVISGINPRSIAQFDDLSKKQSQEVVPIKETLDLISQQNTQVVFVNFCSPYLVKQLKKHGPVIQAYEYDDVALTVAKEVLFGDREAIGEMPV